MEKKAVLAGIFAALSWGTVFVFGQIAVVSGFHPILVGFFRFVFASLFLFFYQLANSKRFFLDIKDLPDFVLLGATGIFGMNFFIFYSLQLTNSTITSLLMNGNGFIIGILGFFLLKEKMKAFELLGLFIGITGCWLILTQGGSGKISHSNLTGNIYAALASFCWAFYSVWAKKKGVIEKYGAILSTFWAGLTGSIIFAIAIFLMKIPLVFDLKNVLISIYLGIVPAGIGFTLWFYSVQRLKTIVPGIIQFLAPLTTAILAIFILNQRLSLATISGGLLIVIGVLFSIRNQSE